MEYESILALFFKGLSLYLEARIWIRTPQRSQPYVTDNNFVKQKIQCSSVPYPDPHVIGPPGSGSVSQRYGSGSFYSQAKIVRKT
jgi:hypothetical protein